MSAGDAAIVLGIVAVIALIAACIGIRMFGRQLNPSEEFTGDQGLDGDGRP